MARLVLINGAPGSGKTSVAELVAHAVQGVALDVDELKYSIPDWQSDPFQAGLEARRLALSPIAVELARGRDVIVSQFVLRRDFVDQLADIAERSGVVFTQVVLVADVEVLSTRLAQRGTQQERPRDDELANLVDGVTAMTQLAEVVVVDATQQLADVVSEVRRRLIAESG